LAPVLVAVLGLAFDTPSGNVPVGTPGIIGLFAASAATVSVPVGLALALVAGVLGAVLRWRPADPLEGGGPTQERA
jgi:hypothetical protein